jgi:hypothetical protein
MRKRQTLALITAVLLAALTLAGASPPGAASADLQNETRAVGQIFTTPPAPSGDAKKKEEKKDKEKPFDEIVKDMEKIEGRFTFYHDPKENKVLIEILPDQFDQDFIYSAKVGRGTGEKFPLYAGMMIDQYVFQWRQLGKRVQFVQKNLRFRADPGSPAARAVTNSFTDSVLASAARASLPHPERNSVLVDLGAIFLSDIHGVGPFLKEAYKTAYKLNKDDSGFGMLKSFPLNSEIETVVNFKAGEFKDTTTIPDPRSLNLHFRYSLVAMPENDYRPRLADGRIGYFMDMFMDFTSDQADTPYVRYITRWNLKKKDPNAAVSEPVEPIVFWLENSIPEEYRDAMREGVLQWNAAFEKAGFRNAMVVKQQPDDADWDPADIRYNTIRWFVGYDAAFAIGPSHTNPYTGQIIDADISFAESILRGRRRYYQQGIHPVQALQRLVAEPSTLTARLGSSDPGRLCGLGEGMTMMIGWAYDVMAARPDWSPEKEKEFMHQVVAHITAHEVGHTLGLRHNYLASDINTMEQLFDTERTGALGVVASVMEYAPPVIAIEGETQGDYYNRVVGTYDNWAIEYGYKPIPGAATPDDERAELNKIASQGADPRHPYATDYDAGFSARPLDPRINHWDHSVDPLAYHDHQLRLTDNLWENMEARLLESGKSFEILRDSFNRTWGPYFLAGLTAQKYIGGIYHNRDHVGDPNGRVPFAPVPASEQQRALNFLAEKVWAPDVFDVPADLLNKLQFVRLHDFEFSTFTAPRIDYPLHDLVLAVQTAPFSRLYNPVKLARLQDSEVRYSNPDERFTMADMFVGVRRAIWSELESGQSINSFRRNLQRAHLNQLVQLLVEPAEGTPEDAVTLARADLVELQRGIDRALQTGGLDYVNRAHLEETRARIRQALEVQLEREL